MFFEPAGTAYDIQFELFGIPVRIHPLFWLVAAILGWSTVDLGLEYLLVWIGCVFISILVHELGHVFAGQLFGSFGHIVLYAFGGLAVNSNNLPSRAQRIFVCAAGPLAGFALLGALLAVLYLADASHFSVALAQLQSYLGLPISDEIKLHAALAVMQPTPLTIAVRALVFINLLWGLLNLLPIWPLDGGQISREVFGWVVPGRHLRLSLGISFVAAGLLALHSIMDHFDRPLIPFLQFGSIYTAVLFGMLAVQSYALLQRVEQSYRPGDDWHERDPSIWR